MNSLFSSQASFSRPITSSVQGILRTLPTQQQFPSAFAATSSTQYTFRPRTRPFFLVLNLSSFFGNSASLSFIRDIINHVIPWRWRPSALFLRRFWRLYERKFLRVFLACCVLGLLAIAFKVSSPSITRKGKRKTEQDGLRSATNTSTCPAE